MEKKKILVVEDDSVSLDLIKLLINPNLFEVTIARDGADGIKKATQLKPDLIFLDIMLPKMNGYEVARAIRKDQALASTPIVVLSARAGENGKERALEAGCQEFIYKPYKVEEVLSVIKRYMA